MANPNYTTHEMDTGSVDTGVYSGHWFDITPNTGTLSFDTRELTLDQFILHLLVESDKVTGINEGTKNRNAAIERLEASIKARVAAAEHRIKVREMTNKLKRAHEYAESPLASTGDYWEKLATEFLKL